MKYTATLACMMLSSLAIHAQQDSTLVSIHDTLTPVEIIGIRTHEAAPFATSDLYKYQFQKYQTGQDIAYTLEALPSIVANSDAGNGVGYTDIRVRGTDMQRINFTLNGIPLNDAESQGTFFVNIPDLLASTHSIQVQRGVGSSTNGPGSFGASINLSNTLAPTEPFIETAHSLGSFNTFKNSIHIGTGQYKSGLYSTIRLSHVKSDGYIERAYSNLNSLHALIGWNAPNNKTSIKFNTLIGNEKTGQAWNGVSQELLETNRQFNELGLMEDGQYYNDQTDNYQQKYFQLFLQHQFNTQWHANVGLFYTRGKGYYNEYRLGESFSDYYLEPFKVDTHIFYETPLIRQLWLDNHFYGAVFNINYEKAHTTLNMGGSISQYDNLHYGQVKWAKYGFPADYEWYNNPAHKSDGNIYLKWIQKLSTQLSTYVDLQTRYVQYTIDGFRKSPDVFQSNDYLFFNPKVGLNYQPFPNHKAYVSFGVANKEPNRDDFESSIEETPRHESLYDIELGYNIRQNKWLLDVQLYYMMYNNQLVNTGKINDVGAYTRTNIDQSFRRGIEINAQYKVHPRLSLQAHTTLSQNKILNFTEYIDDYDNGGQIENNYKMTDISLSPSVLAFAQISSQPIPSLPQLQWDITGRYVGRQYLDNTSNMERSIDPYFTLNTMLQYHFNINKAYHFTVNLSVQNILNTQYVSKGYTFSYIYDGMQTYNYFFPQAGRQYYLTFQTRL